MKKLTRAELLKEFFGMHTVMLKNNESGLFTEDLIERVIKKLCNKENLQFAKSTISEMKFPEISFEFKGINITLPSLDEIGMFSVNSSLYYGENYNNWAIKFYGQYFDLLLEENENTIIDEFDLCGAKLAFTKNEDEDNYYCKIKDNNNYDMSLDDSIEVARHLSLKDSQYAFLLNENTNEQFTIKRDGAIVVLDVCALNEYGDIDEDKTVDERGYLIADEDFEDYLTDDVKK